MTLEFVKTLDEDTLQNSVEDSSWLMAYRNEMKCYIKHLQKAKMTYETKLVQSW